jgi:hypothetical protein
MSIYWRTQLRSLRIGILFSFFVFRFLLLSMALPAHSGPSFRNHFSQTVGLLGRVISPSHGRYINTGRHKHRINAYTHEITMPWVEFEPTIPASERAKKVHALDRATTVTGRFPLQSSLRILRSPILETTLWWQLLWHACTTASNVKAYYKRTDLATWFTL